MNERPPHDKFEPLSEAEISKGAQPIAPADDDWAPITPVPPEVEKIAMIEPHLSGIKLQIEDKWKSPDHRWPYFDAEGRLLGFALRWDLPPKNEGGKPEKTFSFASYGRMGGGSPQWKLKQPLSPRPLYGLDRLAAKPDAVVVVCEGEKSADAAARVFPDAACITSPCGSKAAGKADWKPLAGRNVMVWPDFDTSGLGYVRDVSSLIADLGCDISVIDAEALASIDPDGGKRAPVNKWDAADAIAEWVDPVALRQAAEGLAKPFSASDDAGARHGAPTGARWAAAPLPLFLPLGKAEPFPVDALGPTLARAAKAIASKVQVPYAMAAQSVLGCASLAAMAHADVMLPYGQSRPLSLFFVTIAASGDRKSTADNEAMWPIVKREKCMAGEREEAMKDWRVDFAAWSAEKKKIEGNGKIVLPERKSQLASLGDEPAKPLLAYLTTDDLTVEGLTKNWPDAHAALGVFTAEGGVFTGGHGMSDKNRLKTAAMLSYLWGGRTIKRLRALDGVTILPGRRLAMHIMIQPDAAGSFLSNEILRDQGLLSRVLVAAPESAAGARLYKDPHPDDVASIRAYGARMLSILEAEPALAEGKRNELEPRALPLSEEAGEAWKTFYNHVETQCGPKNPLGPIGDIAAKMAEHAARIAGVITIIEDLYAKEIGIRGDEQRAGACRLVSWRSPPVAAGGAHRPEAEARGGALGVVAGPTGREGWVQQNTDSRSERHADEGQRRRGLVDPSLP